MYMDKDTLYEILMYSKTEYFLGDSTMQYLTMCSSNIKDLLYYPLKDYKCPQNLGFCKHHFYVLNSEFYTREQLLQSHPHLFI